MSASRQSGRNLILIGMPAAGKSTVGVLAAKRLAWHFIDTDVYIQAGQGRRLADMLSEQGAEAGGNGAGKGHHGLDGILSAGLHGGGRPVRDRSIYGAPGP